MPICEYQCGECEHKLEALQSISDEPLTDCPECGKPGLRKLVSAAGFRLKGGGWYETDFKSGNKRNLAGEGKSETKTEAKKSDSGGEAKKAS